MSELEPLDDELLVIIGAARMKELPELDAAAKSALLAATAAKIGPLGGGGGGEGAAGDGGPRGGGGAGAMGSTARAAPFATKAAALMSMLALGIVVGVAGDRILVRGAETGVAAPAAVPSVVPAVQQKPIAADGGALVAELPTASPAAPPDMRNGRPVPVASARASEATEAPSSRGLAAERALLDVARSALARGEAAEALAAATRHAHEYPDGALVEEREAIAVKALVALGRKEEAGTRVRALEQRFPGGLSVRAARASVDSAP